MVRYLSILVWAIALAGGATALFAAPEKEPNPGPITEITMEKNEGGQQRFPPDKIVLRPDANPTSSDSYRFGQLAQWLLNKKHFFELRDRYDDPDVPPDCGGIAFSAVRGGQRKTVIDRCAAADTEDFWEMEMMIRGVAAEIQMRKDRVKQAEEAEHNLVGGGK